MKNQNIENIFSAVEKLSICSRYEEKRTCKHVLGIFLTHSFYQSKGFIYFCGMSLSHSDRSRTKDHYAKFGDLVRVNKTKTSKSAANLLPSAEKVLSENQCPAKRHVFPLRFIYSQAT